MAEGAGRRGVIMSEHETYLGDGLYASFDGLQIRLRTSWWNGNHEVYLDDVTLAAFLQYLDTLPIKTGRTTGGMKP
jgi:hypothetical protein